MLFEISDRLTLIFYKPAVVFLLLLNTFFMPIGDFLSFTKSIVLKIAMVIAVMATDIPPSIMPKIINGMIQALK